MTGTRCGGIGRDLLEAWPVGGQQAAVEVGGNRIERVRVGGEGGRIALVAAHQQAVDLLPEIDEQIGIAQRRQRALPAFQERLGHDVLVRHRDQWDAHAGQPADLGGEHAAAIHDDLAGDTPAVGRRPPTTRPRSCSIASTRVAVCTATPRRAVPRQ